MRQGTVKTPAHSQNLQSGFSLLETLTALTILAIALVSLFEAQSTGLMAAGAADQYGKARILAHSRLALAMSGEAAPRPDSGREGMFGWSVEVSQPKEGWAEISSEQNWRLYQVDVTVSWDRGRRIELQSLKLALSPEDTAR